MLFTMKFRSYSVHFYWFANIIIIAHKEVVGYLTKCSKPSVSTKTVMWH